MNSFRNLYENRNQNIKYVCDGDNTPLFDKHLALEIIHHSHDMKPLKDDRDTNFPSKGGSTQEIILKEKLTLVQQNIRAVDKAIVSVEALHEHLSIKRSEMEQEHQNISNQMEHTNNLSDSQESQNSFNSFCEKGRNKYTTTADFGSRNPKGVEFDDNSEIRLLVDRICEQLGLKLQREGTRQLTLESLKTSPEPVKSMSKTSLLLNSPKYLSSPKNNQLLTSPSSHKNKIVSFTHSNFHPRNRLAEHPTGILEKLRRQKADFNDFKTRFGC